MCGAWKELNAARTNGLQREGGVLQHAALSVARACCYYWQVQQLAQINSVLARHEINILGQYLKTNQQIGYVITDIDKKYSKQVLKDLKEIEHTIKFRVLY